jgi:lysophospholipase L1-like esterase
MRLPAFALACAAALFVVGCQSAPRSSLATHNSAKWEQAILAYEAQDKTNAPAPGCVVFTGSSYIRLWTNLLVDFPGQPVVNRGFGGCHLADVFNYADRIIIPYQPRQIVIYAGGNDINSKKAPRTVVGDFVALMTKLRAALPSTQLAFISCPPSPKRWAQTADIRKTNALIADYCRRHEITFINTFDLMLDGNGLPRSDIYVEDQLHMNANGYAIWRKAVAPHLQSPL